MPRFQPTKWTDEMLDFLKDNIGHMAYDDIAMKLGISHTTIRKKARQLGLVHPKMTTASQWSQEQIDYLIKNYPTHTLGDLATGTGFSIGTVRNKAKELGLKRAEDYDYKKFYRRYISKYSKTA